MKQRKGNERKEGGKGGKEMEGKKIKEEVIKETNRKERK